MARVAFVGLGVMGLPMARHLVRAGHDVTVHNRGAGKAERFVAEHGGRAAPSPAAAARGVEFMCVCVGNDDDVRGVVAGALESLPRDAIIADHTTTSAIVARELAGLAASRGVAFVDAPVSGGQTGAEAGTLTVMCGGDRFAFERVAPIVGAYSRACIYIGPSGSGQLTKMVNQIAIAGLLQGLAEALDFGRRAGLDMDTVIDVISKGAAGSWQLDNRARTMIRDEFDFGFAVELMHKDLGICLDEAGRNGAALEVARLVDGHYGELIARGGRRWDTSSLIRRLRDR